MIQYAAADVVAHCASSIAGAYWIARFRGQ
jgi:hypothetical protein